jgi:hypothetical protein
MSHDVIKTTTRRRMAETGEPYSVARRAVIRQHLANQAVVAALTSDSQQVRRSLTSASGIHEIERRFKAVHWFHGLGHSVDDPPSGLDADTGRPWWQCHRCGSDLRLDGAAGWASSTGTGRCPHEEESW